MMPSNESSSDTSYVPPPRSNTKMVSASRGFPKPKASAAATGSCSSDARARPAMRAAWRGAGARARRGGLRAPARAQAAARELAWRAG